MGKPAARMGDTTAHGGTIIIGQPTVLIGKMPAAGMGDMHVCPMCSPAVPPIPHVGGPILLGSTGVFIGKKPAARISDTAMCVGPPSMPAMGCMTVLLGEAGSGSQAGSAGSAVAALAAKKKGPKAITPYPIAKPPEKPGMPHDIQCVFLDSAGKPLTGIPYKIKDPVGNDIIGVSTSEGKATYSGYTAAGSFSLSVLSLTDVKWSKSKAGIKDKVKYSAKVDGIEDGADGFVTIFEEAGTLSRMLEFLPVKVSGGKIEGEWQWKNSYEARDRDKTQFASPVYVFQVAVEFITARSEALVIADTLKLKVTDPAGKAVTGWNYELALPNGEMVTGKVDDAGWVKRENVPPGKHKLKLVDPKLKEKKAAAAEKAAKAKANYSGMAVTSGEDAEVILEPNSIENVYSEAPDYSEWPDAWLPYRIASRVEVWLGTQQAKAMERSEGDAFPLEISTSTEAPVQYWHLSGGKAWSMEECVSLAEEESAETDSDTEDETDE